CAAWDHSPSGYIF
nr:immunoglobulin light chain junction region [Macaca mulatta]